MAKQLKEGMNLLELLMEHEGGRKNILKYAEKIKEQYGTEESQDENNKSLAMEILGDFKKENKILKIILGISILSNIVIVLLLR